MDVFFSSREQTHKHAFALRRRLFGQVFVHFFSHVQLITLSIMPCLYLNEHVKTFNVQKYLFKMVAMVFLLPPRPQKYCVSKSKRSV